MLRRRWLPGRRQPSVSAGHLVGPCSERWLLVVVGVCLLGSDRRSADRRSAAEVEPDFRWGLALGCALIVAAAGLAVSGLRAGAVQVGPVPLLAEQQAQVHVEGVVVTDPVLRQGRFTTYVVVRSSVPARSPGGARQPQCVHHCLSSRTSHGWRYAWASRWQRRAGCRSPRGLTLRECCRRVRTRPSYHKASWVFTGISRVRAGLTEAASPLPAAQRALVPALVDGDDSGMPPDVAEDFKTTGMTHLLAVSGSNLTLVLGFVLFLARWGGVRAHGLTVVGLAAVVFFVLLARPDPSVLRAAAMGLVALAGLAAGGRKKGVRALCLAVVVLLLLDPGWHGRWGSSCRRWRPVASCCSRHHGETR
ncbi:MAG: ComEC/Rec2 family competence protein [Nocardioidaceae bacterium]